MPLTQIPFQDPIAPEKPQQEQLGLYDMRDWEIEERDLDSHVPHLLIQLQDDLERSRWREAIWISIIVHMVLAIVLWNLNVIGKYIGWHTAQVVPLNTKDKSVTFLTLPPDLVKPSHRPKTNVLSDKDRIAQSRQPERNPHAVASPPPGNSAMRGPRRPQQPQQAQQPPAVAQNQPPMQQQGPQEQAPRPQFQTNQTAQLQTPPAKNSFGKYANGMSPGSAIEQATQAAAASRGGGGGQDAGFGLGKGTRGQQYGALDILSDTQGVDFGPYLQRLLQEVKEHWYELIPESAEMKKGKLALEFAISKDGHVMGLKLVQSSGDTALDRPAWGSITGSNPFPALPAEFNGPYLSLRFRYYYNPDKTELE